METDKSTGANNDKFKLVFGFVLVFALGFATGYYYLDGRSRDEILTITDHSSECTELFEAGTRSSVSVTSGAQEATPGVVLGASAVSGSEAVTGAFAGSKNSNLYHTKDCQYVNRIKAENIVWFGTQAQAQAAGRKAHSCVGG